MLDFAIELLGGALELFLDWLFDAVCGIFKKHRNKV